MKKTLYYGILFTMMFFIGITNVKAETLNCNYTLRKGSKGENVRLLQKVLNEKTNCNLDVDGSFGNLTKACVKAYQTENNLQVDGIVGPKTCASLNGIIEEAIVTTYQTDGKIRGIIVSNVNFREGPATTYPKITTLNQGEIVEVVGEINSWYEVILEDGREGYISGDYLTLNTILVDISDQVLYFYQDGTLSWSTKVVTGNQGNHDTPKGRYTLKKTNFEPNKTLRGRNDDGSRYASFVNYWMPFYGSYGFHDASWRGSWEYTPTRYQGHGSHGCVNMQWEAAKKLYNETFQKIDVIIRS